MSIEKVDKYLGLLAQYTAFTPFVGEILKKKLLTCPCSTKYHGSYSGGLVDHLLNVFDIAQKLLYVCGFDIKIQKKTITELKFCALIHDLGKLGNIDNDFYLVNPDEKKRDKEPFIVNTDLVSMPHELRTFYWLDRLRITNLNEDQYQAICYHAGPYTPGYLEAIRKETPLLVLLHTADNLATKITEQ